ncbi:uncharacterized protein LOC144450360 [Glandiceps talaboti]
MATNGGATKSTEVVHSHMATNMEGSSSGSATDPPEEATEMETLAASTLIEPEGKQFQLYHLKRSAIAYRGHMTRIYADIETLMKFSTSFDDIQIKRSALDGIFNSYKETCTEIQLLLPASEMEKIYGELEVEINRKEKLDLRIRNWMLDRGLFTLEEKSKKTTDSEHSIENISGIGFPLERKHTTLDPTASSYIPEIEKPIPRPVSREVCMVSGRRSNYGDSEKSVTSSMASRASRKAKTKLMIAKLELEHMAREEELKCQLKELQLREERERRETELKILAAHKRVKQAEMEAQLIEEEELWSDEDSLIVENRFDKISRYFQSCEPQQPPVKLNQPVLQPTPAPVELARPVCDDGDKRTTELGQPTVHPGNLQSDPIRSCSASANASDDSEHSVTAQQMRQLLERQQNIMEYVIKNQHDTTKAIAQNLSMPKHEFLYFDGNPVMYPIFVKHFEVNIEQRVQDDNARLAYLIQYCTGPAKEAIRNCVILPPNKGYKEAKSILHKNFGQKHIIVRATIDKVVHGSQIKASESEKLLQLARDMNNCHLSSEQMNYRADINSMDTLEKIVKRLPPYLQADWAKEAGRSVTMGVEPEFIHLTRFLENRAAIANTRFGKLVGSRPDGDRESKVKSRNKYVNSSAKVTTLSTQGTDANGNESADKRTVTSSIDKPKVKGDSGHGCLYCRASHKLERCWKFARKSYKEKRDFIREHKLCDCCLEASPPHFARNCKSGRFCPVTDCGKRHHPLLHLTASQLSSFNDKYKNPEGQPEAVVKSPTSNISTSTSSSSRPPDTDYANGGGGTARCGAVKTNKPRVSLQVIPVKVGGIDGGGPMVETYAFLDNGSDTTICLNSLVDKLGLMGKPINYTLSTLNAEKVQKGREVQLDVKCLHGAQGVRLDKVWTTDNLPITGSSIPNSRDAREWSHLKGIELPELDNKEVTILIGNDVPEAHWVLEERLGQRKQPYAVRTLLGWTLIGPMGGIKDNDANINFINIDQALNCDVPIQCSESISSQLYRMYNAEFNESLIDTKECMSLEDRRAKAIMDNSVCIRNGHYQLALPWRYDNPCLSNNKSVAVKRLNLLKQRLARDLVLHDKYKSTIEDYIVQGHARRVPDDEHVTDKPVWYLPHHPVFNPQKPDKTRVVFDCAATYRGTSLNGQLLQGPDLSNSLVGVLLRFRQEPVALVADIKQMFHQVRVDPKDWNVFRFLWCPNGDLSKQPVDYQMVVHLFGATSSPSCASYALKKTADDNRSDFEPRVIDTVYRNFYVDDCLKSVPTDGEATSLVNQLSELLERGGFHLTKWISNSRQVLASIPAKERAPSVMNMDLEELPVDRALGVQWNIENDTFNFRIGNKLKEETRRGILSCVASVYDPLGFASPFILPAKCILQELCRLECGWDDDIPEQQLTAWREWRSKLEILKDMEIPRCYKPVGFGKIQRVELHHFSDASMEGYGVVSYIRLVNDKDNIHCCLVMGKSRVAPLKTMTIPRLELAAATVSVKVNKQIQEELQLPIHQVLFWTDSTIVLQYIHNSSRRFQTFVSNRLQIIHDASTTGQWYHVPSEQNPADYASRGIQLGKVNIDSKETWFAGPEFLWKPKCDWPSQPADLPEIPGNDKELRRKAQVCTTLHTSSSRDDVLDMLLHRYSSWYKLQKSIAWLLRFKVYMSSCFGKNNIAVQKGPLTVHELSKTTEEIVRIVQKCIFPKEMESSWKTSATPDSEGYCSPLRKLSPVLREGILCVGGRLDNAAMSDAFKHPIILPHNHLITELLVRHYHEQEGHVGANHVLSVIRRKFWIVRGLATVRRVIGRCIICKRWNSHPGKQVMAPLPEARVTPGDPPFTSVGVDYFGPLIVKWRRGTTKRYGCVFTCLAIRAVHIEVAHSLSTDSFIQAVWRFVSRRGPPRELFSDNGTNFRGAEFEVKQALENWNQERIIDNLRRKHIQWHFNPPAASHAGGVWERMIRSIRKILRSLLGNKLVDDETLLTFLTEAEKILNDRPLVRSSDDPADLEPLTPNSLLLLRPNTCTSPSDVMDPAVSNERRWQVQHLVDLFWKRWMHEYLPTLQERQKWLQPKRNLCVGDLILIMDESATRGHWQKGIVEQTYPDRYGVIRQVLVKTATGRLRRDVRKLCLLEGALEPGSALNNHKTLGHCSQNAPRRSFRLHKN